MKSIEKLIQVELDAIEFGFDWPHFQMIIDQAIQECKEINDAINMKESDKRIQEEIGDLLHSAISMCVFKNFDIEETLNYTAEKFTARIKALKHISRNKGLTTLKNQPIELLLDLWHEAKSLSKTPANDEIVIRDMNEEDITLIVKAFEDIGWFKPCSLFAGYLDERVSNERFSWVALYKGEFAGYVTLKWNSHYKFFKSHNIPEIKDLNVSPKFRNKGIGSKLIAHSERSAASEANKVGLGVGLYAGYANAFKLYIKKGYVPDGNGVTYNDKVVKYNEKVSLDNELVVWFIKALK